MVLQYPRKILEIIEHISCTMRNLHVLVFYDNLGITLFNKHHVYILETDTKNEIVCIILQSMLPFQNIYNNSLRQCVRDPREVIRHLDSSDLYSHNIFPNCFCF